MALERGYRSTISLPLKDESARTFGVLVLYSSEHNVFTPNEIRMLEELAGDLAFGISTLQTRAETKKGRGRIACQRRKISMPCSRVRPKEYWSQTSTQRSLFMQIPPNAECWDIQREELEQLSMMDIHLRKIYSGCWSVHGSSDRRKNCCFGYSMLRRMARYSMRIFIQPPWSLNEKSAMVGFFSDTTYRKDSREQMLFIACRRQRKLLPTR